MVLVAALGAPAAAAKRVPEKFAITAVADPKPVVIDDELTFTLQVEGVYEQFVEPTFAEFEVVERYSKPRNVLEDGQPHVVFDMQGVPLVDSRGLELLLQMHDAYKRLGGDLKLASVNPLCAEILKITGVGPHFEIYRDTGAAVGSFVR